MVAVCDTTEGSSKGQLSRDSAVLPLEAFAGMGSSASLSASPLLPLCFPGSRDQSFLWLPLLLLWQYFLPHRGNHAMVSENSRRSCAW